MTIAWQVNPLAGARDLASRPFVGGGPVLHFCHSSAGSAAAHTCATRSANTTCMTGGEACKPRVLHERLHDWCTERRLGVNRWLCRLRVGRRLRREGGGTPRAASLVFEPGLAAGLRAAAALRVASEVTSVVLAVVATSAPTSIFVLAAVNVLAAHCHGFSAVSIEATVSSSGVCAIWPRQADLWLVRAPSHARRRGVEGPSHAERRPSIEGAPRCAERTRALVHRRGAMAAPTPRHMLSMPVSA